MRISRTPLLPVALLLGVGNFASAQSTQESSSESPAPGPTADLVTGPPVVLNVARQHLKNFLVDETALTPYKNADGGYRDLESVFTVGTDGGRYAVFWDPVSCRLLGALDLKAPHENPPPSGDEEGKDISPASPYTLLASGDFPLNKSSGAYGEPEFFGFRMTDGKPAFLYTYGALVVEERIWLDKGGDELKQRFTLRDPKNAVILTLPEAWVARAEASVGEWEENVLTVPKEEAAECVITYQLAPETTEPEEEN